MEILKRNLAALIVAALVTPFSASAASLQANDIVGSGWINLVFGKAFEIDAETGSQQIFAAGIFLNDLVVDVEVESARTVLAVDFKKLVRIDPKNGSQEVVWTPPVGQLPVAIAIEKNEDILVLAVEHPPAQDHIYRIDHETGQGSLLSSIPSDRVDAQPKIEVDSSGTIWVATNPEFIEPDPTLLEIDPTSGQIVSSMSLACPIGWTCTDELFQAGPIAFGHGGELFALLSFIDDNEQAMNALIEIDTSSGLQSVRAVEPAASYPGANWYDDLEVESDGNMLSGVYRIEAGSWTATQLTDPASYPYGLAVALPRCSDGIDNDGDGAADYPADGQCAGPNDDRESGPVCGLLGIEMLVVPAFAVALRRRRKALVQ